MKNLLLIIIATFSIFTISAQSIKDKQLEVMKEFTTSIYEVNPIASNINIVLPTRTNNYQIKDSLVTLQKYSPNLQLSIQPISYNSRDNESLHSGYATFNKGSINQWNGELGYTHVVDNYFTIDTRILYDEWKDNSRIDQYSQTIFGSVGMKYYLSDNWFTSISIGGGKQQNGAYGYNDEFTQESTDTIATSTFDLNFALQSFNTGDHDFNVSFVGDVEMTNVKDQTIMENLWTLSPSIMKNFGNNWSISNKSKYITTSNREIANTSAINNLLSIKYKPSTWSLSLGGTFNRLSDQNRLFPYLQAILSLDDKSKFAIQVEESLSYNGLGSLIDSNPYIQLTDFSPSFQINQKGAISYKSIIAKDYEFELEATYSNRLNAINYIGIDATKYFDISHVDYKQLSFDTKLQYNYTAQLSAGIDINYNRYESNSTLFHRPDGVLQPFVKAITPDGKLSAELSGLLTTKQKLYTKLSGETIQSGLRKDISLQVSYTPLPRLNLYFNADNIINDDFEALSGYSVYSRNLSGGLLFKF